MRNLDIDRLIAGWRGPALAALVAILAALPGLALIPPIDRDESRYAESSAQMLETGDVINIQFQNEPRHKKPVGIYWAQAASAAVFAPGGHRVIWPYRIPSILGAALAAAACAWGAGRFWGPRGAATAGGALAATILLATEGFFGTTDGALAGTTTLAMAALARIWGAANGYGEAGWRTRLLFWLGLSAAILIKGPIAPMIIGLTLVSLAVWERKAAWMKGLGYAWGVPLLLVLTLPWAIAITLATHGAFWTRAVGGDLATKVVGGQESHGAWPGFYLVTGLAAAFPMTLLVPAAIGKAWSKASAPLISVWLAGAGGLLVMARWKALGGAETPAKIAVLAILWALLAASPWLIARWRKGPAPASTTPALATPARFALCWLIPSWLVFELAPTKLPHYVLPLYPALAWLVADALSQPIGRIGRFVGAGLAAMGGLAIAAAAVYALSKFGNGAITPWATLTVGFALAGAFTGAFFLLRRASGTALIAISLCAIFAHTALVEEAARLRPLWPSRNVVQILAQQHLLDAKPITLVGYAEPSAVFALGAKTELADKPSQGADAIAQGRTVVVEAEADPDFLAAVAARGLKVQAVTVERGFNYTRGRSVVLTVYRRR